MAVLSEDMKRTDRKVLCLTQEMLQEPSLTPEATDLRALIGQPTPCSCRLRLLLTLSDSSNPFQDFEVIELVHLSSFLHHFSTSFISFDLCRLPRRASAFCLKRTVLSQWAKSRGRPRAAATALPSAPLSFKSKVNEMTSNEP